MIKRCEHEACGQPFEAKRADARYCGASCRAAASRARRVGVLAPQRPAPVPELVATLDPDVVARIAELETRVEALAGRVGDGQAKASKALASVAEELGQDRNDTNERVCDLEERVQRLARRKEPVEAAPAPTVDTSALDTRLGELEQLLRRVRRRLGSLEAKVAEIDEVAAAAVKMLAEVE